jgi:hypothetical protein
MLRVGGFESLRRRALVALPLLAFLAVTSTAAYAGLVSRVSCVDVPESSALALSIKHPGYAYTLNDDDPDDKAIVYTIKISTGEVVGRITLKGVVPVDPEALSLDRGGRMWFADVGKDGRNFATEPPTLWMFTEPSTPAADHEVSPRAYVLAYPSGKQWDVETLLINPQTNARYLVTKEDENGKRLALPSPISSTSPNLVKEREKLTDKVSDGSFTPNGKWAVIRSQKKAYVYYPSAPWRLHASFDLPAMYQPESLSFDPKGNRFLVGSECKDGDTTSPLYWVQFDQSKGNKPK